MMRQVRDWGPARSIRGHMEQARVPICLLQIFAEMFIGPFGSQAVVDREKESTKGLTENSSIKKHDCFLQMR